MLTSYSLFNTKNCKRSSTYLYTNFSDVFEKHIAVKVKDFLLGQLFHNIRHSLVSVEYVLLVDFIHTINSNLV